MTILINADYSFKHVVLWIILYKSVLSNIVFQLTKVYTNKLTGKQLSKVSSYATFLMVSNGAVLGKPSTLHKEERYNMASNITDGAL